MPTDELKALESDGNETSGQGAPRSGLLAGVALLLALGALALAALMWWEGRDEIEPDGSRLDAALAQLQQDQSGQASALADLATRIDGIEPGASGEQLTALQGELEAQETLSQALQGELATQQQYTRTLQQAIESMQARLMVVETGLAAQAPSRSGSPEQFSLAGVEYLLRLAPERLTLFHDVRAADEALASADAQLAAMENPVYLGLRQHVADARRALSGTKLPNQVELSASLDAIQQQLASLTFGGEASAARVANEAGTDTEDAGWWQRLKSSLASLVTVRRSAEDAESRLTIEDKDLLRQGLWMQIEGARLALMRHDQASWDDTLARALDVLTRWFDSSSADYAGVHDALQELAAVSVSPELPDISGPWAQLQLLRSARPAPVAPAPEASSADDAEEGPVAETPEEPAGTEET